MRVIRRSPRTTWRGWSDDNYVHRRRSDEGSVGGHVGLAHHRPTVRDSRGSGLDDLHHYLGSTPAIAYIPTTMMGIRKHRKREESRQDEWSPLRCSSSRLYATRRNAAVYTTSRQTCREGTAPTWTAILHNLDLGTSSAGLGTAAFRHYWDLTQGHFVPNPDRFCWLTRLNTVGAGS